MTIGEKIKRYRKLNGYSQEYLGELSNINAATIKKYEYGIRNPKPDQLQKIANALGVSIFVFMDFDIFTQSDLLSLLIKMDEETSLRFEADRDENGNIEPDSVKLSFDDPSVNSAIALYLATKTVINDLYLNDKRYSSKEEHNRAIAAMSDQLNDVKDKLLINKSSLQGPKVIKSPTGKIVPITEIIDTNNNNEE